MINFSDMGTYPGYKLLHTFVYKLLHQPLEMWYYDTDKGNVDKAGKIGKISNYFGAVGDGNQALFFRLNVISLS